jgi:hypothetical protein
MMAKQVNAIFDVLYDKRKHFQKYVRAKLKEELQSMIRMETCREIKKTLCALAGSRSYGLLTAVFKPGKFCLSISLITLCFFVLTFFIRNVTKQFMEYKNLSQNGLGYYQKSNEFDQHRSSLMLTCTT